MLQFFKKYNARLGVIIIAFTLQSCGSLALQTHKENPDFIAEYLFRSKKAKTKYFNAYNKTLKLFKMPVEEIDVATRYGTAHILAAGPKSARPLVLLHGMDASSTMWYPNFKALSQSHRVYAIDYIMDAGKSQLKSDPLNNDQVVKFYTDVFDGLKIEKADILGTSRGGWIAAWLSLKMEDRINKLVLLSPAQVLSMVDFKIFPAVMYKMFPSRKKLKRTMEVFAAHPERVAKAFQEQFYIATKYGNSQAQVTKMMPFSTEELESIKVPTLVLMGDHDVMNPEKAVEKAKEHLKNAQIEVIPDSGHFMSTDQTEIVDKKILDFLH